MLLTVAALGSLQSGRVTVQSRWHPAYDATSTKGTSSARGFQRVRHTTCPCLLTNHPVNEDAGSWCSVRKPLISDDGPVAGGFYEHPRLAVTIPCAILVRILRDHLGPLRTSPPPRQWHQATVAQRGCAAAPRHHDRRERHGRGHSRGGRGGRDAGQLSGRAVARRRAVRREPGLLAKENDTMIVPRSSPNVVPRTTGVGTIPRWGTSRSAVSPPGTFCPPLPPFVVDYVSRQRISSAVVAARGRGSSSRAKASRRTASSGSGRYSVCSTQMFTYGPSRNGSLLCTCPYRFTVASGTSFIAICVRALP